MLLMTIRTTGFTLNGPAGSRLLRRAARSVAAAVNAAPQPLLDETVARSTSRRHVGGVQLGIRVLGGQDSMRAVTAGPGDSTQIFRAILTLVSAGAPTGEIPGNP